MTGDRAGEQVGGAQGGQLSGLLNRGDDSDPSLGLPVSIFLGNVLAVSKLVVFGDFAAFLVRPHLNLRYIPVT